MRRAVGAALTLLLAAALPACTKTQTAGTTGGLHSFTQADTLRVALYQSPNTLNPILGTSTAEAMLESLVFDPLVTVNPHGDDVPVLAAEVPTVANGGVSKDGKTVTYKLRKNVKWHDGAPFTSDDVKFSWQAIMNNDNKVVSRHGYDDVASVDTPDRYTVVFHLKKAFAPFVDTVFGESDQPYRIIPKHLLAKYPNLNAVPFNSEPVGTGPYKFAKWIRGDRLEYVANPDYFLGAPKIKNQVWKIILDSNTQIAQMKSHEVDWVPELNGQQYRDLRDQSDVTIAQNESPQYEGIAFNLTHPPLDDLTVRQALVYGIDAKKIMDSTQFGAATLATADIPSYSWAYNSALKPYPYDPAKANALLDGAGWKMGANGIRVKNGQPLSLQFIVAQGSSSSQAISTLVQAQLKQIGVDTQIKGYTYAQLYATASMGGILNGGKFDLSIYAWVYGSDPDDSSSVTCAMFPPNGNNIFHYCNKEVDAAENDAMIHPDRATRKAAYAKTQALIAHDLPEDFLFYRKQLHAINPDLKGFAPNGVVETWNAYQWSF